VTLRVSSFSPLRGEARLPGDKSIAPRAALFGALAEGDSRIDDFLDAGVTRAMLGVLRRLGVEWALHGTTLHVHGQGREGWADPTGPLNCRNSATTLRLTAGALAGLGVSAVLDGSPGLRRRPMGGLVDVLGRMGAPIQAAPDGHAPLALDRRAAGASLRGGVVPLPSASAQLKSAVLLAGLGADGPISVVEPGPSRDHSERMLEAMGAAIERDAEHRRVTLHPPRDPLRPLDIRLPGDLSAAAFLIAAALIVPGSAVRLRDVGLNPTRTGLLDVLREMGAALEVSAEGERDGEPCGSITVGSSDLRGVEVGGDRVVRMVDEFPIFAVVAAFARGTSRVREAEALRGKESDRIRAICLELSALGAQVEEHADGFSIHGSGGLRGGAVRSHGDHRLALALAVAGMGASGPVEVEGNEVMEESFPGFIEMVRGLEAQAA
jgi:3-phosphoshikimate 1-carboxyvinyltransferase